jgi:hypothetical protein
MSVHELPASGSSMFSPDAQYARSPPMLRQAAARGEVGRDELALRMTTEIPRAFIEGRDPVFPSPPEPETRKSSLFSRWFRRG